MFFVSNLIIVVVFFLFFVVVVFTLKGYWLRGKKLSIKKIPLVARPCKEDSRKNKKWGDNNLIHAKVNNNDYKMFI